MAAPTMSANPVNVLAGPMTLYLGLFGATEPADTAVNAAPAASAWTSLGSTTGGITVTVNQSMFIKRVDQVPERLGHVITERDVLVATQLSEAVLERLSEALNESPGASSVSTGSGYKKYALTPGFVLPYDRALLADGFAPGTNKRRRFVVRRINSVENVGMPHQKDGLTVIPVTWAGMYVDSTTPPFSVTDEQ